MTGDQTSSQLNTDTPPQKRYTKTSVLIHVVDGFKEFFLSNPLFSLVMLILVVSPAVMTSMIDVPLSFSHPISFDPTTLPRTIFIQLVICLMAIMWGVQYLKGRDLVTPTWHYLIFGAFLIWGLVSTLFSPDPQVSFFGTYTRYNGLLSYLFYFVLLLLLLQIEFDKHKLKVVAIGWIVGTIPVTLYAYLQAAGLDPVSWSTSFQERIGSLFGNPNMLGAYLIIPAILAQSLALAEQKSLPRAAYWLAWINILLTAALTFNRSTWIIIFVAALIIGLQHLLSRKAPLRGKVRRVDALPVAFILGIILYLLSDLSSIGNVNADMRLHTLFQKDTWIHNSRAAIWQACIQGIANRPILGWGFDNINLAVTSHFTPEISIIYNSYNINVDSAHNLIIQQLVSTGIIGTILQLVFYASILITALVFRSREKHHGLYHALIVAGIAHFIQMMAVPESSINQFYFVLLIGVQLSVLKRIADKPKPRVGARFKEAKALPFEDNAYQPIATSFSGAHKKLPISRIALGAASIVVGVLLAIHPLQAGRADNSYSRAMVTADLSRFDWFDKAISQDPSNTTYVWKSAVKAAPVMSEDPTEKFVRSQINTCSTALVNHPHNPTIKTLYLHNLLHVYDKHEAHLLYISKADRIIDAATISRISHISLQLAQELGDEYPTFPYATYLRAYTAAVHNDMPQAEKLCQEAIAQAGGTYSDAELLLDMLLAQHVEDVE